jgi:hypothetical protein
VSVQDGSMVCAKRTTGLKIILDAPMELQCDLGCVESRFGLFGDSVSVGARWVHSIHQTYHNLGNQFGHT